MEDAYLPAGEAERSGLIGEDDRSTGEVDMCDDEAEIGKGDG